MSSDTSPGAELSSKVNAAAVAANVAGISDRAADGTCITSSSNNEIVQQSTDVIGGGPILAASNGPDLTGGGNDATTVNNNGNCLSLTLMQSSPPPHSYRHSRAYRHFKNPPQPHMCIRTTTEAGEELFINVLSWTRIVIPQEPSDPIPLYGGMRVPPGSPRSPPIVFAVMANPEVLKDSGRHSKDPEERRAMVELMCDFVEAMNPGVKLVRNAVILKDRDISGELKDVWNAVQAQRDREREEQMLQQRQQQHYHNVTTQQMFPKSSEILRTASTTTTTSAQQLQKSESDSTKIWIEMDSNNEMMSSGNAIDDTIPAASSATVEQLLLQQPDNRRSLGNEQLQQELLNANNDDRLSITNANKNSIKCAEDAIEKLLNGTDKNLVTNLSGKLDNNHAVKTANATGSSDQIDASSRVNNANDELNVGGGEKVQIKSPTSGPSMPAECHVTSMAIVKNTKNNPSVNSNNPSSHTAASTEKAPPSANANSSSNSNTAAAAPLPVVGAATPTSAQTSTPAIAHVPTPVPTKKEKLGGFLPNGCIFPRFKNNKHKDKDKDKEKESKPKEKEKTLLNALKKSKEKKVAPSEQHTDKTSPDGSSDTKTQYEKNCINLENEVQKLDLNKIDTTAQADNMFIKLKVAATSAAAK